MENEWLKHAVFYEIYPQSFKDTNADGIGDLKGILEKLDYIEELGCNAIWINPCFDSPFVDAGYDVRNYYKVAERYGTNQDLKAIFEEAHARGMHVLLDLVAGHTSVESEWFKQSCKPEKNEFTDRYIWTDTVWNAPTGLGNISGWYRGGYDRDGAAALNFFTAQVALNYGFAKKDEGADWEQDMLDEGPMATRKALRDVMEFWLNMGADGFRVDMAGSLVKNDFDGKGTIALWQDIRKWLDEKFPDAVLVSEWGEPDKSLEGGFQMDFVLHFGPSHYPDLFRTKHPYFRKDGKGDIKPFMDLYLENKKKTEEKHGYICIPSGNHDMDRMARTLDTDEMCIAFAFLLSMPGVPFIYYGDEIGMRYVEGLSSKEGGYQRTGSRTPMQWDKTTNAGFSSCEKEKLYLPQDEEKKEDINVESEMADEKSLWSEIHDLIEIHKEHPAFQNDSSLNMISYGKDGLIYERSCEAEKVLIIINPNDHEVEIQENTDGEVFYSAFGNLIEKAGTNSIIPAQSAFFIKK